MLVSTPPLMKKLILWLFVRFAHAAIGGSLPIIVLFFSSRVFKLHGGDEKGCKGFGG